MPGSIGQPGEQTQNTQVQHTNTRVYLYVVLVFVCISACKDSTTNSRRCRCDASLTHQIQAACLQLHIIMLFQDWWETQAQMERKVLWVPAA